MEGKFSLLMFTLCLVVQYVHSQNLMDLTLLPEASETMVMHVLHEASSMYISAFVCYSSKDTPPKMSALSL